MLGAAFALAMMVPAMAAAEGPAEIVKDIYAPYLSTTTMPRPPFDLPIYSSHLKGMIGKAVEGASEEEPGQLDFDVFLYAQDYQLSDLTIRAVSEASDRAEVEAAFKNMDRPTTVVFRFVKEDGAWKVDDIAWPEGQETLTGILSQTP